MANTHTSQRRVLFRQNAHDLASTESLELARNSRPEVIIECFFDSDYSVDTKIK